jgi:hypothetical protein
MDAASVVDEPVLVTVTRSMGEAQRVQLTYSLGRARGSNPIHETMRLPPSPGSRPTPQPCSFPLPRFHARFHVR